MGNDSRHGMRGVWGIVAPRTDGNVHGANSLISYSSATVCPNLTRFAW